LPSKINSDRASVWEALRKEFEALANEQLRIPGARPYYFLSAHESRRKDDEAVHYYVAGQVTERIREAFNLIAIKAGRAISSASIKDPIQEWLKCVFADARINKSGLLKSEGLDASITDICEASAVCCLRLERQSLERDSRLVTAGGVQGNQPGHAVADDAARIEEQRRAVIAKLDTPSKYTFLSTPEAALHFEVVRRTIYRWVQKGKLKAGTKRGTITIASVRKLQKERSTACKKL
jgi:hypothetical protein